MVNYREILRLTSLGYTQREIARSPFTFNEETLVCGIRNPGSISGGQLKNRQSTNAFFPCPCALLWLFVFFN